VPAPPHVPPLPERWIHVEHDQGDGIETRARSFCHWPDDIVAWWTGRVALAAWPPSWTRAMYHELCTCSRPCASGGRLTGEAKDAAEYPNAPPATSGSRPLDMLPAAVGGDRGRAEPKKT
jgi:hypothetical protein